MKKRTKSTNEKIVTQINTEEPTTTISLPQQKPKQKQAANTINVISDTAKIDKQESSKELKSMLLKNKEDSLDARVITLDSKTAGWRKIEFSLDHQMPICKDYHDTGYCTFGAACKFLHTRDDVSSSEQYERKLALKALQEKGYLEAKPIPQLEICQICKKYYTDPVITKCKHKFCSKCAIERYRSDPTCAICGKNTDGIFNSVPKTKQVDD
ncbi:Pre-mRNA-splicing factor CWC24 [Histomonas meleagridis]|uniref:Pre-mRNA-splicing factor CWC24 n=1 Tax=Histomonas meleagridis TaxID=135588 RepID=UPI00355A8207|nr:Pre-mRNA-splicing factor CWC24 [Histomonas meleagridis]KAH0800123.1 Pre-mRNA-splicing factor CWC24 [Histomonas meleagridis]